MLSQLLYDTLHEPAQVVVGHQGEQHQHDHNSRPENRFLRLEAERFSLYRLEKIDHDLSAVEHRNRKKIEHREIGADEGD